MYQNLDSQKWSTTSIVALVATASLTVGVTAGVVASSYTNAQTTLYAPVATATRPATMAAAPVPQQFATRSEEAAYEMPEGADAQDYEVYEPVQYVAAPQSNNFAVGLAAAVSAAVGAVVYKVKSAQKQVPTVGALTGAALYGAGPANAGFGVTGVIQETNSMAPIATALFIILPTFFLITLFVATNGNKDAVSGSFDQDYYDKSKAAGNKKTNEAARLRGPGLDMYAKSRK